MTPICKKQEMVVKAILEFDLQEETGYYVRISNTDIFLFFHYDLCERKMVLLGAYVIGTDGAFFEREISNFLPAKSSFDEFDLELTPVE